MTGHTQPGADTALEASASGRADAEATLDEIRRTHRQAMATRPGDTDSWLNGYREDVAWLLRERDEAREEAAEATEALVYIDAVTEGAAPDDLVLAVKFIDDCWRLMTAERDEARAALAQARALVREAYLGDHPTNAWRKRAEDLGWWPLAVPVSAPETAEGSSPTGGGGQ